VKIKSAEFKNFKLLEDVRLEFSTDPKRPLTVVRAENGSGKTSILYALLWGFFGVRGLPSSAQGKRLSPYHSVLGEPVDVQVTINFTSGTGETIDYRLIRTVREVPTDSDLVDKRPEKLILYKETRAGLEDVPGDAETIVGKMLPERLKNVFFTDGEDVQHFISDNTHGRQSRVHEAIKTLLGLDLLNDARVDIEKVDGKLRREEARAAGGDLEKAEKNLASISNDIEKQEEDLKELTEKRGVIQKNKSEAEKELNEMKGAGNIDELNQQIKSRGLDLGRFEQTEKDILGRMKRSLLSQDTSWSLAGKKLEAGYEELKQLADLGVIPGVSLGVLTDRLELGVCICEEPLSPGSEKRLAVENLIEEQRKISEVRARQTETFHSARSGRTAYKLSLENRESFVYERKQLLGSYAANREALGDAGDEIKRLKDKRKNIDEERVQALSSRVENADHKLQETSQQIGKIQSDLAGLNERREIAREDYNKAEKASKISSTLKTTRRVTEDIKNVIAKTLDAMEQGEVARVQKHLEKMFLEIVGSNPEQAGAVYQRVEITESFDINVKTANDGHLDADFEINGAAKRALTLSFIWALMEVSRQVAPRLIDTPLGVTSGGTKRRMVEAITTPSTGVGPEFQTILLLTRSEIRDIEDLLDARAGSTQTLSCNGHYPDDLTQNWEVAHPLIRRCECSHKEFCDICERRFDDEHNLVARGAG